YIDKDYRSTFYNFYVKKGQQYRGDCVRLHFFDQTVSFDSDKLALSCPDNRLNDHYFGYMVLRPTGIATIGRTVLSPDIRPFEGATDGARRAGFSGSRHISCSHRARQEWHRRSFLLSTVDGLRGVWIPTFRRDARPGSCDRSCRI